MRGSRTGRAAATTLTLRRGPPAVDGKSGAIAAWRGAARRHPPCAKPTEGALPDTEVGKGARAVPDKGRSASHGKGDLSPCHRSVAKSSGEGGAGGRGAGRPILEGCTLDICLAAMCPMVNTTINPPKVVV